MKSLTGAKAWIISDRKAGHEAQCLGVAEALGVDVSFRHITPSRIYSWLAPYASVPRSEKFAAPGSVFEPPWPDIALSAGRLTAPYMRALKQHAGSRTFTTILLDPKIKRSAADLFWVPAHDQRRGPNVITTLTPPHRFSPALLATLRQKQARIAFPNNKTKVVVLLGGDSRTYRYTDTCISRLIASLKHIQAQHAFLMVTASRRTPAALLTAVRSLASDGAGYIWDGEGINPLAEFYAFGDCFIVTADSINMTAEPCVTGKPVYVFHPRGGSDKFQRFHTALERHGATRRLGPQTDLTDAWSYAPLFASETIAEEITKRWAAMRPNATD
jgi:uncharacterized protein